METTLLERKAKQAERRKTAKKQKRDDPVIVKFHHSFHTDPLKEFCFCDRHKT